MIILPGPSAGNLSNAVISIDDSVFLGVVLDGVKWRYSSLTGWGAGAGVETNDAPRPNAHGSLSGPVYRRSRVITVAGEVVANSRAAAKQAEMALASLLADGSTGTFAVDDPDLGYMTAQVHLADTPMSDATFAGAGIVRWSMTFSAPDWRKYGEVQTQSTGLPGGGTGLSWPLSWPLSWGVGGSSGRVSFTNTGNAPSEPTFTVSATLASGFEITRVETAQRLRYVLPVTDDVVIDCAAGTVTSVGERRERYLTVRQWPSLAPGETGTFQFSTLGSETYASPTTCTGTFAPAYH